MRGIETLTLAALVGLVGIGIWQGHKWFPDLTLHKGTAAVSSSDRKALEDLHSHSAAKTSRSGNHKAGDRRSLDAAGLPLEPSNSIVVIVPSPTPPNQNSFPPGATRSQLREEYGEPALDVVARRDGRLIERYYYSADQTHFVVATLHDGSVVSSETVSH
jgi:hypothetical protein